MIGYYDDVFWLVYKCWIIFNKNESCVDMFFFEGNKL